MSLPGPPLPHTYFHEHHSQRLSSEPLSKNNDGYFPYDSYSCAGPRCAVTASVLDAVEIRFEAFHSGVATMHADSCRPVAPPRSQGKASPDLVPANHCPSIAPPHLAVSCRTLSRDCGLSLRALSSGRPDSAMGPIWNESVVDARVRSEYGNGADGPPIISKRQTQS